LSSSRNRTKRKAGDHEVEIVEITPPPPKRQQRRSLLSSALEAPLLPLSKVVTVETLADRQHAFQRDLRERGAIEVTKDFKKQAMQFAPEEIIALSNFFFTEMISPATVTRISKIVQHHNRSITRPQADIDIDLADKLATDVAVPASVREFASQYRTVRLHSGQDQGRDYKAFFKGLDRLKLYRQWQELRRLAKEKDPGLVAFLSSRGYVTSRGVGYMKLVKKLLSNSLRKFTARKLQNYCQGSQGISYLVDTFGQGVLLAIPPTAGGR